MATGTQLHDIAVSKRGYRYQVGPSRTTGAQGYFDCSGLVTYAARACGILSIPTVSWTQALWCHANHTDGVSFAAAWHIPGVLVFKGPGSGFRGFGPMGHVAITMGDGVNVIEAKGKAWGVLVDPEVNNSADDPWTNAAYCPGISYGASALNQPTGGNPMYATNQICDVYSDGEGHSWGLDPTGAVYTFSGGHFYGSYQQLHQRGRTDFAHITARLDGKPGYSLWPVGLTNPMEHYDFPVGG